MPEVPSGTYGRLRLVVYGSGSDAVLRYSNVSWELYFEEVSGPNLSWNNDGVSASVVISSIGTVWSGSFTFDWRPAGLQGKLIAAGTNSVGHNPDGTPPANFSVTGSIGATGSSGGGSGASVNAPLTLLTLKVLP